MKTHYFPLFLALIGLSLLLSCKPSTLNEPRPHYQARELPELFWPPEISGWTYEKLQDDQNLPASGEPFYYESPYRKSTPEGLHFFNETQAYKRLDLLQTVDGGFTWQSLPFEADVRIIHTYFWNPERGVVAYVPAGEDSLKMAFTEDGGVNWKSHTTNLDEWATHTNPIIDARLYDLWFSDGAKGIFLKKEPTSLSLWATQDSGKTWDLNYTHTSLSHHRIQALDSETVLLSKMGELILSQDAGQSWQVIADFPEKEPDTYGPSSFEAMSIDTLFYQVGGIHHSSVNGGQSWTRLGKLGEVLRWKSGERFRFRHNGRTDIHSASNQPYDEVAYFYLSLYHKPSTSQDWIEGSNEVANQGISRFYHAGPDIIVGEADTKGGRVLFRYLRN